MDYYQTWRSGKVVRMHTMPQLHRENVAEHTWGMLLAIARFYPDAPAAFLMAVILHDAGEISTGDVPAHVKNSSAELEHICQKKENEWLNSAGLLFPTLTEDQILLLTVFDKLDFCMSCIHEMRLGNLNAARYYKRSYSYATKAAGLLLLSDSPLQGIAEKIMDEIDAVRVAYCRHVGEYEYDLSR